MPRVHGLVALVLRLSVGLALLSACEEPAPLPPAQDAGAPDAGGSRADAGFVRVDAGDPIPDAGSGPPPCSPPLELQPRVATVLPLSLLVFQATGGTGKYRFSLESNESGALINDLSSAYLAGELAGARDVVGLRDLGCVGTATAGVHVVTTMLVQPNRIAMRPTWQFRYRVTQGSGRYAFAIAQSGAGGVVDATGLYTARSGVGRDVVRVTDVETGETVDTFITVDPLSALNASPKLVGVPVGSEFALKVVGGSGNFAIASTSTSVVYRDDKIMAVSPGRAELSLTDEFTGESSVLKVRALPAQTVRGVRIGDRALGGVVIGPGDVDGDGFKDALLGLPSSDANGIDSGAVYLFRGRQSGLETAPARTFTGRSRSDGLGAAVVTGDFTGDNLVDIAIGAPLAETDDGPDVGLVYIYAGMRGGTFSAAPIKIIGGARQYDQFGSALAACDFNHDGRLDLAVGATNAEDTDATPVRNDQGGVLVFLGHPDGFLDTPDLSIYGQLPIGGGDWEGVESMRLGAALGAGDVDGDGACDLVAATHHPNALTGSDANGMVAVYQGIALTAQDSGGVRTLPSRAWGGTDADDRGSQLGRSIAVGDLDGDGRAEVAVGQWLHDAVAGMDDNRGAVRVFRGDVLAMTPPAELLAPGNAAWTLEGDDDVDQLGYTVQIADADGDMAKDLLVGSLRGEISGGAPEAGTIAVFRGRAGLLLPDPTPLRVYSGQAPEDRFGQAFATIGDVDRDGSSDLVAYAGTADYYGPDVGVPYLVPGNTSRAFVRLGLPGGPSGSQVGGSFEVVGDVDGDSYPDLVVGAPLSDSAQLGLDTGAAYYYRGRPTGFDRTPSLEITAFNGLTAGDQFGYRVSRAGDFDRDGVKDFAVVSRWEDDPGTYDARYVPGVLCSGGGPPRSRTGAVYIYRGRAGQPPRSEPSFVYFGPQPGKGISTLAGGFDVDADGYSDVLLGGGEWDRDGVPGTGGIVIIGGRQADRSNRIVVICEAGSIRFRGANPSDALGTSAAVLGDLDQDGCDDLAIGTPNDDLGVSNQGSVRVLFGWGGARCPPQPRMAVLRSGAPNAYSGTSLAGGFDVDGDRIPDLAVGAPGLVVNNADVGGVWLIPGSYLLSRPREPMIDGGQPFDSYPFLEANRVGNYLVEGTATRGRFGASVALIPGAAGNLAALAVGAPEADVAGVDRSGGVRLYRFNTSATPTNPRGLEREPIAAIGGETARPGGLLGERVGGVMLGVRPIVLTSGSLSSGGGLDNGAVYWLDLTP